MKKLKEHLENKKTEVHAIICICICFLLIDNSSTQCLHYSTLFITMYFIPCSLLYTEILIVLGLMVMLYDYS